MGSHFNQNLLLYLWFRQRLEHNFYLSMEKSRSFPRIQKDVFTIEILFCSCPKKVLKIKNENMQLEKQKPILAQ